MSSTKTEAENHQSETMTPGQDTTDDSPNDEPQESMEGRQKNPDAEKTICLDETPTEYFTADKKVAGSRNQSPRET